MNNLQELRNKITLIYKPLQDTLKLYTNNNVVRLIIAVLIFYTVFLAERMPLCLSNFTDNIFFKLFLLIIVLAYIDIKPEISVLIVIAYLVTMLVMSKKKTSEGFLNIEKFSNNINTDPDNGNFTTTTNSSSESQSENNTKKEDSNISSSTSSYV